MRVISKYIFGCFILLLLFVGFWFFFLKDARENRLMKEGNILVVKIEAFRAEYKRLPSSLEEIGVTEQEGVDALYFSKQDSLSENYMIWFGTSLSESKTYYSDSKKWEEFYRKMK